MAERDKEIHALRQSGLSYAAIAKRFGISRVRVRQICLRADERQ
jgi:DNA-binding CsgD family transcriptional regulator